MGKDDNRRTPKMRRRKSQKRLKERLKRRVEQLRQARQGNKS